MIFKLFAGALKYSGRCLGVCPKRDVWIEKEEVVQNRQAYPPPTPIRASIRRNVLVKLFLTLSHFWASARKSLPKEFENYWSRLSLKCLLAYLISIYKLSACDLPLQKEWRLSFPHVVVSLWMNFLPQDWSPLHPASYLAQYSTKCTS